MKSSNLYQLSFQTSKVFFEDPKHSGFYPGVPGFNPDLRSPLQVLSITWALFILKNGPYFVLQCAHSQIKEKLVFEQITS